MCLNVARGYGNVSGQDSNLTVVVLSKGSYQGLPPPDTAH